MNSEARYHVIPINDIQPHREDEFCICNPTIETYDDAVVITHNSFDGRELSEERKEIYKH